MPLNDPNSSRALRPGHRGKKPVKPPAVAAPHRAAPLGPLGRADAPILHAQRVAHRRVQRATRRVERNVVGPALPKLAHPTSAQRAGAGRLLARSGQAQGIMSPAQIRQLPRTTRERFNRGRGYATTLQRNVAIQHGAYAQLHPQSVPQVHLPADASLAQRLAAVRDAVRQEPETPGPSSDNLHLERMYAQLGHGSPVQRVGAYGRLLGATGQRTPASVPSLRDYAAFGRSLIRGERVRAHEGNAPPKMNVAGLSVDISPLATLGKNALSHIAAGHGGGVFTPNVAARFGQGALRFPVTAVQSGVAIADATRQALGPAGLAVPGAGFLTAASYAIHPDAGRGGGNFEPAKELGQGFAEGTVHSLTHPLEDPFLTAVTALGTYGAIGRVAGGLGRAGMAAGRVARVSDDAAFMRGARALGDTRRAPALPYEGAPADQAISRSYSKNALTKLFQARSDARTGNLLPDRGPFGGQRRALRSSAHEFTSQEEGVRRTATSEVAHGLVQLVGKSAAGRITSSVGRGGRAMAGAVVHRAKTGDAAPVVDEAMARLTNGRKLNRTSRDVLAAMVDGRVLGRLHGRELTPDEFRLELRGERLRLEQAAETDRHSWTGEERRLNRLQRRALRKAEDDPRVLESAGRLHDVSRRIVAMADDFEESLIKLGVLDRRQALIAKVRVPAIARFGHRPITAADRSRLSQERSTRIEQYLQADRQHAVADRAYGRAADEARMVDAYRRSHPGSGVSKDERKSARREYQQLRERLGIGQDGVRRLAETIKPTHEADALAALDAAERRAGAHELPQGERAHAEARARHARAVDRVERAETELDRAKRAQARAIGGEQVRRGQAQKRGEAAGRHPSRPRAERRIERAKAELHDAREAERAARETLEAPAAQLADFSMGLVDRFGQPVTTEDVLAQMQREGVPMPGYLRQARGPQVESWFRNWLRPSRPASVGGRGKRTGTATVRGGYASDWHAIVESLVRRRGDVAAVEGWDRFIRSFGITKEDGTYLRPEEVEPYLREHGFIDFEGNPAEGLPRLQAVWAYPKSADRGLVEGLQGKPARVTSREVSSAEQLAERDVIGPADELTHDEVAKLQPPHPDARIVLVPAEQLRAFTESQQVSSSTVGKTFQAITNLFRSTVLPFSVKWLTGNVAEAFLRLAVAGARPTDLYRGHKILRELLKLDEEAYQALHSRSLSGLLFGSADQLRMHTGADRFRNTTLEGTAQAVAHFGTREALTGAETPVGAAAHAAAVPMRLAIEGLGHYVHGVFRLNTWMERQTQVAALGKYGRLRSQEFTGSWIHAMRMQETAARQVAEGLLGTPEQIRFARYVDETLGKYSRFSPTTRRVIQTVAPFLPWYLNALRFVYHTLPAKHPVLTSLLAHTAATLGEDMKPQNVPPGDLESAIPMGGSKYLTLARYTPFGAFTNGALDTVTSPIFPQFSTAFGIAAYGVNFTGRPLDVGGDTEGLSLPRGKRALLALNAIFESFVPAAQIARRLQEHGETPYDDSWLFAPHTKPGTATGAPLGLGTNDVVDAANRVLNPFRPVALHPQDDSAPALPPGLTPAEQRALQQEFDRAAEEQPVLTDEEQRRLQREFDLAAGAR